MGVLNGRAERGISDRCATGKSVDTADSFLAMAGNILAFGLNLD